jgi:hypothetical protein
MLKKNLLCILPWKIYTLIQNCQLDITCVKQFSSTVKEFTVAWVYCVLSNYKSHYSLLLLLFQSSTGNNLQMTLARYLQEFLLNYFRIHGSLGQCFLKTLKNLSWKSKIILVLHLMFYNLQNGANFCYLTGNTLLKEFLLHSGFPLQIFKIVLILTCCFNINIWLNISTNKWSHETSSE